MTLVGPQVSLAVVVDGGRLLLVHPRVPERGLPWVLPGGKVEPGESATEAAVRETLEETGLTVAAGKLLGERVHPKTGRLMSYTACDTVSGTAHVADADELAEVAWTTHAEIGDYVPYGLYEPVQAYLDGVLPR